MNVICLDLEGVLVPEIWVAVFKAYKVACDRKEVRPGKMLVYDSGGLVKPNYIVNFPTKDHWRGKSKVDVIRSGLHDLVEQVRRLKIRSIAIPPLGCGNGGLDWDDVRPLIEEAFARLDQVDVRVFAPDGTPDPKTMEVGTESPAMTPGRAAILKALETYRVLGYGLTNLEIQKLAYFLQLSGEDLKLKFEKHHYGPYSDALRHALNRMEGHFVRGVGDGSGASEVEPVDSALEAANVYLQDTRNSELGQRVGRVANLIDGFQSPYGMELLATVHWAAARENASSADDALRVAKNWNERKARLMQERHVRSAWNRLVDEGWLTTSGDPR